MIADATLVVVARAVSSISPEEEAEDAAATHQSLVLAAHRTPFVNGSKSMMDEQYMETLIMMAFARCCADLRTVLGSKWHM